MSKGRAHRFVEDRRLYGFGTTCCWPGCYAPLMERKFPLCTAHTKVAHDYQRRDGNVDYVLSCSIEVPDVKPPERQPTPAGEGVVYYVEVSGRIKIGWTSSLEKRMRAYPPNSRLLAVEPGTRKDEQRLHRMFATYRTHGREWYAPVPSLLHHIEAVKAEHGEPVDVAFGAQPVTIPQRRETQTVKPRGLGARFVA